VLLSASSMLLQDLFEQTTVNPFMLLLRTKQARMGLFGAKFAQTTPKAIGHHPSINTLKRHPPFQ
jgi:hypothetical protein